MDNPRKSSYSSGNGQCVEIGSYRKSSRSESGNCVEAGSYRKASYSALNGGCVEVGTDDGVGVRDTMQAGQPGRTEIRFPAATWRAFTGRLKEG